MNINNNLGTAAAYYAEMSEGAGFEPELDFPTEKELTNTFRNLSNSRQNNNNASWEPAFLVAPELEFSAERPPAPPPFVGPPAPPPFVGPPTPPPFVGPPPNNNNASWEPAFLVAPELEFSAEKPPAPPPYMPYANDE